MDLSSIPTERLHEINYIAIPGVYDPSPWQKEFHALKTDEALGAGAAGVGKSIVLLYDAVPYIVIADELCKRGVYKWGEVDDGALHVRRLSTGLRRSIRRSKKAFRALGDASKGAKFNENDGIWTFRSGFTFTFGHCKNVDDYLNYFTDYYCHLAYDELPELEKIQYDQLNGRIRSESPVFRKMLKVRAASNPAPGWVREYFVDPTGPKGRRVLKKRLVDPVTKETSWYTRMFLPGRLDDNPDKAFVEDYKRRLMSRPAHIRDALLYGNWYIVEGAYFADHFRPDLHVIRPFRIPGDWPVFRCLDWGFKTPGCCLWIAVDPDGNFIVIRELTFKNMDGDKVAQRIREIEQQMGYWANGKSKLTGPADVNLWGEYSSADDHAEKMAKVGVLWVKADKKSRAMNAQRLVARLDDHNHGMQKPGVMIFDTCKRLIQTLPTLPIDENDPECYEKCNEDHWTDALVYGCAYRTRSHASLSRSIKSRQREALDDEEKIYEQEGKGKAGRGQLGYGANY